MNNNENGNLGIAIGAFAVLAALFFIATGGSFGGKTTVESDKDLPPGRLIDRARRGRPLVAKHRGNDGVPFIRKRIIGGRLAGLRVPITRVGQITFDTMEIGVHPGGILAVRFHDQCVRLVPVVFAGPPQGLQGNAEARRWCGLRKACLEFVARHHQRSGWKCPAACSMT